MSETKKKVLPRYRGHSRLLKSGNSGSLSVPSDMMILLTEGLLFKPELTKDGILFKIVDEDKLVAEDKTLPAWVKKVTAPATDRSTAEHSGPIPPVNDDHPDNDLSDEVDETEGDDEPPVTDDDETPF
jgi:hypothetical protein